MIPRTFAPAPGWSADGHRIKALLEYSRGDDRAWVYGALRVRDGKELTRCAASRNSTNSIELLKMIEADNPTGDIFMITDNLSSHNSLETRTWLADHLRLQHVFIPKGARLCSICRRAGGACSVAMPSLGRALLMPMRSSERRKWQRCNSITEPSPGCGGGLLKRDFTSIGSFVIAFEECSSRIYKKPYSPCRFIKDSLLFHPSRVWLGGCFAQEHPLVCFPFRRALLLPVALRQVALPPRLCPKCNDR